MSMSAKEFICLNGWTLIIMDMIQTKWPVLTATGIFAHRCLRMGFVKNIDRNWMVFYLCNSKTLWCYAMYSMMQWLLKIHNGYHHDQNHVKIK